MRLVVLLWMTIVLGCCSGSKQQERHRRQIPTPPPLPVDTGCFDRYAGVCVPMEDWVTCPRSDDLLTWKGCSHGSVCCYQQRAETTKFVPLTTPPPQHGACGISYVNGMASFRVVGGWKAEKGEWPWLGALVYDPDKRHMCGVALVEGQWLVTAAHCFIMDSNKGNYHVVMGEYDKDVPEAEEQKFIIEELHLHAHFDTSTKSKDIALIKLDRPVKFTKHVQRICLPDKSQQFEGQICTVAGWGVQNMMSTQTSRYQMEVNLPLLQPNQCQEKIFNFFNDTQMCAGFQHGMQDACGGDSGGPLMCRPYGTYRWQLAGVVSWGNGCALPGMPGIYTKVTAFLDWIQQYTKLV
ncbi:chymotrypsinogen A-like [Tubulanus polymorphus]|uniref:chymotrypsinogen A-like n=1 Tax=Tubulanus polymorphus TaxID=672921 RepID=UPI003DA31ECB